MPTCRHDRVAISNLDGNRNQFPGGHKARPYDEAGGGSVGAAFMAARNRVRSVPGPGGSGSLAAAGCLACGGLGTRHARPY